MFSKRAFCIFVVVAVLLHGFNPLFAEDLVSKGTTGSMGSSESNSVKVTWEDDKATIVRFSDRIVDAENVLKYSNQFHVFLRKIGEKSTKIVLGLPNAKLEIFKPTLSSIFLKAVADENSIREHEGLQSILILLHLPLKTLDNQNMLEDIKVLSLGLVNYIDYDGIVSGVIFETSLIIPPYTVHGVSGNGMKEVVTSSVAKLKRFLQSLQFTFGYELKMGLSMSSYDECLTCLVSDMDEIIYSFDLLVIGTGTPNGNQQQETCYYNCMSFFQKKFSHLVFYHVKDIFDFKN